MRILKKLLGSSPVLKILEIIFALLFITYSCYIAAQGVLNGTITFHTDIGRDFYLMQDMVERDPIALIGPGVRGHDGLYHGSLWFYLNLPAFIVGKGDPILVGWFWILLFAASLAVYGLTTRYFFDYRVALWSTAVYGLAFSEVFNNAYNPIGVLIIFPLYVLTVVLFWRRGGIRATSYMWFMTGILIQFHLGFGLVALLVTTLFSIAFSVRRRTFRHIPGIFSILIPLGPFILFDVRHGFPQFSYINSVLQGGGNQAVVHSGFWNIASIRLYDFTTKLFKYITPDSRVFPYVFYLLPITAGIWIYKKQGLHSKLTQTYSVSGAVIFLCMMILAPVRSNLPIYQYWGLAPVLLMFAIGSAFIIHRILGYFFVAMLIITLLPFRAPYSNVTPLLELSGNWYYYKYFTEKAVQKIPDKEFGYYALSPELLAYSSKYAIEYTAKVQNKKAIPFEKRKYTVFLVDARPDEQINLNVEWFLEHEVRITSDPIHVVAMPNGAFARIYKLMDEELRIPSNPNLDMGRTFR